MLIPQEYHGHWSGIVTDSNRAKKYLGIIILDAHGVTSRYEMERGPKSGELSQPWEEDGCLVLNETVGSLSGTLRLSLNSDGNLKCVWRSTKPKSSSDAIMTRINPIALSVD